MVARFILSLDCEGKWGLADRLNDRVHRQLSDARLRLGYEQIVALLDEFGIPATFAFVGLFASPQADFHRLLPELHQLAALSPSYLAPALADLQSGSRQGWHGGWAIEQVQGARTKHELALHGVTHIPWNGMSHGQAELEMKLLQDIESPVRSASTFVYPRNQVAHVDLLRNFGIVGYRESRPATSRLVSLFAEFNIFTRPELDEPQAMPRPIPAGHFVNWQSRLRRVVPIGLSTIRAARMLTEAAWSDAIVHFWLHPENVVTAPRTLVLLRRIMELVARQREAGRCRVMTQHDYCRSLAGHRSKA